LRWPDYDDSLPEGKLIGFYATRGHWRAEGMRGCDVPGESNDPVFFKRVGKCLKMQENKKKEWLRRCASRIWGGASQRYVEKTEILVNDRKKVVRSFRR